MEQTIGKRIAENRKRLALTQDQLAEQLGLTAQAVSKWENDQSCPDITMLPKLADIFGISTDELLGRPSGHTVHQAEVVTEDDECEPDGIHLSKGTWSFHWDSGRRGTLVFAVFVLTVGILTLLSEIFHWYTSFWKILWPTALVVFGLNGFLRRRPSVFSLGIAAIGGYFLVANLGIWQLNIAGELLFPIMIVLFGIGILFDALRKPQKPRFHIARNGGSKTKSQLTADEGSFHCDLSFGEDTRLIHLPRLERGELNCSFGELTVDLSGCEEIAPNCEIEANCSFGELILLVPRRFRIEADTSTAFANADFQGQPEDAPQGTIRLNGSISFGNMEIRYI